MATLSHLRLRAGRADRAGGRLVLLKKKKAKAQPRPPAPPTRAAAGNEEVDALVKRGRAPPGRLQAGRRLGSLPIFFLVGDTGSTKTSVMVNAGLEPELLAGLVYRDNNMVPTRTANLWFSRRTIFAEAGGKLPTEPAKWDRLMRKLQPARRWPAKSGQAPRAVLVCYDAENFTRPGAQESATAAARNLRARLGEMSQAFGINLPVYVLFTNMDRLPFFTDYVRNLTKEEAGQVVGATIPMRDVRAGGVYGEEQTARLTADFERLFRSLADARPEFLGRETDATKQPGAYEFPREFRKIRPAMVQFLVDLCQPSQLTVGPFLRGFYFTGVRPVVINEAAPVAAAPQAQGGYGSAASATGLFKAGQAAQAPQAAPQVGATRKVPQWLFLTHLFNDVLLADRPPWAPSGSSVKTGSARRVLFLAAAVLCLLLCIAFTVSFFNNRALETQARDAADGHLVRRIVGPEPGLAGCPAQARNPSPVARHPGQIPPRRRAVELSLGPVHRRRPLSRSAPHLLRPLPPVALPANPERHSGEPARPPPATQGPEYSAHLRRSEGVPDHHVAPR